MMKMKGLIGADKTKQSRKKFVVLAFCIVVVNSIFLMFAASGTINYFGAFGIIPITFLLCAFALLVTVAKSRGRS